MVEEIKKLLEKRDKISLSELKKRLKVYGDFSKLEELTNCLSLLEIEGICFFDELDNNIHKISDKYIFAEVQTSKKGNLFIENDGKHVKLDTKSGLFLPLDKVILDKNYNLIKVVERKINNLILEIVKDGKKKGVKVVGNSNFSCFVDSNDKVLDLPEGTRFLASVDNYITGKGYLATFENEIGHKNDFDDDLLAIAYNNGFRVMHNDQELKQVLSMPKHVTNEEIAEAEDHRNDEIFTIDGANTKDIDDAVSIQILPNGNYLLKVYIAHVSHYIKFGSPLWQRAEDNTTSLYFANKVSHMLHYIISNGICSLNEGEDRLAKGYFTEITPAGKIVDFRQVNTVINSKKKMTYEDVNSILESNVIPPGYEPYVDTLHTLNDLATILAEKRKKAGALFIDNAEVNFELDSNDKVEKIELRKQETAEHLIENLMVITNEAVAEYMMNLGLKFVYRNHDWPYQGRVDELKKTLAELGYKIKNIDNSEDSIAIQKIVNTLKNKTEFFVLISIILKTLPRAYYSTDNHGHFGLASKGYSQCTSPIRRFLDLVIETIFDNLEYFYSEKCDINEIKAYLDKVCMRASMMERMADKGEYEAEKLRMCDYISNYPDEIYEAYVSKVNSNGLVIKTKDEHIEGNILLDDLLGYYDYKADTNTLYSRQLGKVIKLGSQIYVKLKMTDKDQREIYFYEEEKPLVKVKKM